MPIYKYRFCDGKTVDIEVGDKEYALLKEMDKREQADGRRHKRQCVSLDMADDEIGDAVCSGRGQV